MTGKLTDILADMIKVGRTADERATAAWNYTLTCAIAAIDQHGDAMADAGFHPHVGMGRASELLRTMLTSEAETAPSVQRFADGYPDETTDDIPKETEANGHQR